MIWNEKIFDRCIFLLSCLMLGCVLIPLWLKSDGHLLYALSYFRTNPLLYIMLLTPIAMAILPQTTISTKEHYLLLGALYLSTLFSLMHCFSLVHAGDLLQQQYLFVLHFGIVFYFLFFSCSFLLQCILLFFSLEIRLFCFLELEDTITEPFCIHIRK